MNTQTKTQTTVDFKCKAQHEPLINYAMQHLGKSRKIILRTNYKLLLFFFLLFSKKSMDFSKG